MIIDVIGLGESISLYTPSENISFGVNDINRLFYVDHLVCVDKPNAFPEDRKKYISNNTAKAFYSQFNEWNYIKNFNKIELQAQSANRSCDLDSHEIPHSIYSPFVAICLAWKLFKPSEIHLYGVDIINHNSLSTKDNLDRILKHTRNLKRSLEDKHCQLIVNGQGLLKNL